MLASQNLDASLRHSFDQWPVTRKFADFDRSKRLNTIAVHCKEAPPGRSKTSNDSGTFRSLRKSTLSYSAI